MLVVTHDSDERTMNDVLKSLKATADPQRLRILAILSRGPFNVAEVTEILGVGQSTVSRHLKILADADHVEARRSGSWAFYALATDGEGGFPRRLVDLLLDSGALDLDADAIARVLARRQDATSAFFRSTARDWDRVRDRQLGPPVYVDRLLEMVGAARNVVDLGTGTGVLLASISSAERVIGVDASPEMLEVARERALPNTDLRLGTLEHLPLSDGEADVMIANMVLHHVADLPTVLREIHRGLAGGGRLVVADVEEHPDETFWRAIGARWPGFRRDELTEWLEAAGFERVRFEAAPEPPLAYGNANGSSRNGTNGNGPKERPRVFLVEAHRSHES
jgi:ArsR family transcriptional regulator